MFRIVFKCILKDKLIKDKFSFFSVYWYNKHEQKILKFEEINENIGYSWENS